MRIKSKLLARILSSTFKILNLCSKILEIWSLGHLKCQLQIKFEMKPNKTFGHIITLFGHFCYGQTSIPMTKYICPKHFKVLGYVGIVFGQKKSTVAF